MNRDTVDGPWGHEGRDWLMPQAKELHLFPANHRAWGNVWNRLEHLSVPPRGKNLADISVLDVQPQEPGYIRFLVFKSLGQGSLSKQLHRRYKVKQGQRSRGMGQSLEGHLCG